MVKVEIFVDSDPNGLEDSINQWLEENQNISIKAVTQSGEGDVTYTILYEIV